MKFAHSLNANSAKCVQLVRKNVHYFVLLFVLSPSELEKNSSGLKCKISEKCNVFRKKFHFQKMYVTSIRKLFLTVSRDFYDSFGYKC